jgi:hypothetical protein
MTIPIVPGVASYQRLNNVLLAVKPTGETIPLVRFKQRFPDLKTCNLEHLQYMEKYITINPKLCEVMEPQAQKNNIQLSIFD